MEEEASTSSCPGPAATPTYTDRCRGAMLGAFCGDVLGAGVERASAAQLRSLYPDGLRCFMMRRSGQYDSTGCYTDDTQMAIALAESLVAKGHCDATAAAHSYATHFQHWRGYQSKAKNILTALKYGTDYHHATAMHWAGGSFGNGSAMRIAPIGLAYRHASKDVLKRAVYDASMCTGHIHPEGIDGALVQAAAVAWLCCRSPAGAAAANGLAARGGDGHVAMDEGGDGGAVGANGHHPEPATPEGLLRHLLGVAETPDMQCKLQLLLAELPLQQSLAEGLAGRLDLQSDAWQHELAVGSGPAMVDPRWAGFQIKATDAVAVALWALACHWGAPQEAVVAAVHHGGDCDTVAGIAGALAGALHGSGWLPARWLDNLENGQKQRPGRDAVAALCDQLALLDVRQHEPTA